MLKTLNGDYQPTSGKYLLDGAEKHFKSPHEAIEEGISIIYQERQILLELSVAENIYLGRMPVGKFGMIDTAKANHMAEKIIEDFGLPIRPDTKVKDLSIAYQQMVEIMKAYSWEGGEGKVTTQYEYALVGLALQEMRNGNWPEAKELLTKALRYPDNLGEGKLEGTKDNHIHYYLGVCEQRLGNIDAAKQHFETATFGTDEPAGMMYYNDQPADMILFEGLAKQQLGEEIPGKSRFNKLIDYGERHMKDDVRIGYFAVSLPDFQIFEEDWNRRNKAHCYYLIGLGNLGYGKDQLAAEAFRKCISYEATHWNAIRYLDMAEKGMLQ